jgi:hypothetical protein
MLFCNQLDRAIKFSDKLKEEKALDPVAAQLILERIVKEKKSLKPSSQINEKHLDWCVDTLGFVWKDVRDKMFCEIFDVAIAFFEVEMLENPPEDFGDAEHEKLFELLSEAFDSRYKGFGVSFGIAGYYSDDDSDDDANKDSLRDAYRMFVALFREMKSIPQFPQKKLDDRKEILYNRERALESLVYLDIFRMLWDYKWNHSSKFQHLANACQVLLG